MRLSDLMEGTFQRAAHSAHKSMPIERFCFSERCSGVQIPVILLLKLLMKPGIVGVPEADQSWVPCSGGQRARGRAWAGCAPTVAGVQGSSRPGVG